MPLWIDKYRPKKLADLNVNTGQKQMLETMLKNSKCNIPHILIYGPPGSGKKTRVDIMLRQIYGNAVDKKRFEKMQFTTPSNKKIEIDTTSSNYHLEVNPSDANLADRFVVQELIKHVASSSSVASHQTVKASKNNITFKTIVIYEADKLTRDAQHALRRTMEKYMGRCRCILLSRSSSRIIDPLVSRCLAIKCRAATNDELLDKVYPPVAKDWHHHKPDDKDLEEIVALSNRDMRKFLLLLEVYKVQMDSSGGRKEKIENMLPDWECFIKKLCEDIKKVESVNQIPEIRKALYELICHLIPPHVIFNSLLQGLIDNTPMVLKQGIIDSCAKFEHRARNGSKEIYHLEAFVVEFLALRKDYENTGKVEVFDLA